MGILSWIVSGLVAALLLRLAGRQRPRFRREAFFCAVAALLAGFCATALDFGGLDEIDLRAMLFTFAAAALFAGLARLAARRRQSRPASAAPR